MLKNSGLRMDRSWMYGRRNTIAYLQGVEEFCRSAVEHQLKNGDKWILCPCIDCRNIKTVPNITEIKDHVVYRGFMYDYTRWIWHGESILSRASPSDHGSRGEYQHGDINRGNNVLGNGEGYSDKNDRINDTLEFVEDNFSKPAHVFQAKHDTDAFKDKGEIPKKSQIYNVHPNCLGQAGHIEKKSHCEKEGRFFSSLPACRSPGTLYMDQIKYPSVDLFSAGSKKDTEDGKTKEATDRRDQQRKKVTQGIRTWQDEILSQCLYKKDKSNHVAETKRTVGTLQVLGKPDRSTSNYQLGRKRCISYKELSARPKRLGEEIEDMERKIPRLIEEHIVKCARKIGLCLPANWKSEDSLAKRPLLSKAEHERDSFEYKKK